MGPRHLRERADQEDGKLIQLVDLFCKNINRQGSGGIFELRVCSYMRGKLAHSIGCAQLHRCEFALIPFSLGGACSNSWCSASLTQTQDHIVMSSQTVLLALHLIGLAFGIGASTILDLRTLRLLYGRPVSEQDLAFAEVLSTFVRIGLLLLLISGLGLLLRLWLSDPALLANPKLHAKLMIVGMLTLNGFLIERIALPLLRRQCGRPLFEGVCYRTQVAVLAMGVVSATSWYLPFLLGIARELNFGPSALTILSAYLALICLGVVVTLAWRSMHYRPSDQAAIPRPSPFGRLVVADNWNGAPPPSVSFRSSALSSSARAIPAKKRLEHIPEKLVPVFRKGYAPLNHL